MIHSTKSWRRAAAAAVAAGLVVAGLGACAAPAGGGDESGPLTLTIWGDDTDKAIFEERLALAKEALPDIEVKLVQISKDYDTKLQTLIAGGDAPDIMQVSEQVNVLSSKGILEDLNPYFDESGLDPAGTWGQGSVDSYTTGDSLWAAPDRAGAAVLYYNKDIFDAQGVAYPDGTWGWDEFRDAAKALTKRTGDTVDHYGYAAGDWWVWYLTWIYQNGGSVLDESGAPVANSPENIEALEFYNDMVFKDGSAPSPVDYANEGLTNGQPDPLFAQGKLAMETTGFWNISSLAATELNWDIAPMWHGVKNAVPAFGSGFAVSSHSKHKDAAAQLVEFLTSAAGQVPLVESGRDIPSNLESLASDAFQNPTWNTSGVNIGAFADSATSIYSPPLVPEWTEIQGAFSEGLDATWKGEQSVEDGLNKVQEILERLFR
jgi:multiple sugar transport system substrate-binding protein